MKNWILLLSFISTLASAEPNACNSIYEAASVVSASAQRIEKTAEVLARKLSEKQIATLKNIFTNFNGNYVTRDQLVEQIALLKKANFTEKEIRALRQARILAADVINSGQIPNSVLILDKTYESFGRSHIADLKSGKTLRYFVDEENKIQITSKTKISPDEIPIYKGNVNGTSGIVKEYGSIEWNAAKNEMQFKPSFSLDLMDGEIESFVKEAAKISPEIKMARPNNPGILKSQALKCNDILSANKSSGNYVLDSMISGNAVTISALAVGELAGAGRLDTPESRQLLYANLTGSNVTSLATLPFFSKIAASDMSVASALAARSGLTAASILGQKEIYTHMSGGDASTVNSIAAFDTAYSAARLPQKHYLDKFIIHKLPTMILNSCYKNSKLQFLISPRMVRMYDAYSSTILYYGARQGIIGQ